MPTLIDLSQVAIAGAMFGQDVQGQSLELTRHIVLNSLRMHHLKNKSKFGETIICADSGNTWRKEIFPFYKAGRRKDEQPGGFDWNLFFSHLNTIKQEIRDFIPFRLLSVPRCEADDIIAVLTRYHYEQGKQPTMIISSDKDFKQLHTFDNVFQFSPMHGKPVVEKAPESYLRVQILKGDPGDGIPNILSKDDIFVDPARPRQKAFVQSRLDYYLNTPITEWDEDARTRYNRNKTLIDLVNGIPKEYSEAILNTYRATEPAPKRELLNYMVRNRLSNLINSVQDFM